MDDPISERLDLMLLECLKLFLLIFRFASSPSTQEALIFVEADQHLVIVLDVPFFKTVSHRLASRAFRSLAILEGPHDLLILSQLLLQETDLSLQELNGATRVFIDDCLISDEFCSLSKLERRQGLSMAAI